MFMIRCAVTLFAVLVGGLIGFIIPLMLYGFISYGLVGILTLLSVPLFVFPISALSCLGGMFINGLLAWDEFDKFS